MKKQIEKSELKHPPIEWRGRTIEQWYASSRTVEMNISGNLTYSEERCTRIYIKVTYKGGVPERYEASISYGPASSGVHYAATAEAALEAAASVVQAWSKELAP